MKLPFILFRIYFVLGISCGVADMYAAGQLLKKSDKAVRIMTYNIRRDGQEKKEERKWVNRLPLIHALLEKIEPDIMGLQEAKANQIDDLLKTFDMYAAFGKGRGTSWWGWGEDEHSPIFYNKNKFTLLVSDTFSLNPTNAVAWLWDVKGLGLLPRVCTYGKFKNKQTGQEFYLYNTHLDHKFVRAQLNGLRVIKKHIDARGDNLPVIITGDFNTQLTDAVMNVLPGYRAAKNMAQKTFGPDDTRTGWDDEELKPIDHILINADAQVDLFAVIAKGAGIYPSDHRPVFADIVFDSK